MIYCLWQAEQGPPKDAYIPVSDICEYITSQGKRDFAYVIKLMILRWGDYDPELSR